MVWGQDTAARSLAHGPDCDLDNLHFGEPRCPTHLQHEQNDLQGNEPNSKRSRVEKEQKKEMSSWFAARAVCTDRFFCAIECGKQHDEFFLQGRRLFAPVDPCGKERSWTTFKTFNATASQLPLDDHPSMSISLKALVNVAGSGLGSMGDALMHHDQDKLVAHAKHHSSHVSFPTDMRIFLTNANAPRIVPLACHSFIAPLVIHLLALSASHKSSSCGWAALAEMIRLHSDCGRPRTWSQVTSGNPDCDECAHSPSLPNPIINDFGLANANFVAHCTTLAHGPAESNWADLKHETSGCALCPLSSHLPMSFWADACGSSSILVFDSPIVDPVERDELMSVCSPRVPGELGAKLQNVQTRKRPRPKWHTCRQD